MSEQPNIIFNGDRLTRTATSLRLAGFRLRLDYGAIKRLGMRLRIMICQGECGSDFYSVQTDEFKQRVLAIAKTTPMHALENGVLLQSIIPGKAGN